MDAVPITLGQEFAAWAQAVGRDWWRMSKAEERLRQVNLGGTAVGTGLNADRRYVHLVVDELRGLTGLPVARAENLIDATQNLDQLVEASGLAKTAATTLFKLSADLRLLGSGPAGGIGELRLPPLQAGSSIMPGKINPVACEAVGQAAIQIIAGDAAISFAAASGQLELNPFLPLIAHNLLLGLDLLAGAATLLARRTIRGLVADEARCRAHLEASTALVTALSPYIGYEEASRLAQESVASGKTVRELAAASGHFSAEELARILDPTEMTHPGVAGLSRRPR
jgi:aspartate ammonia-lyase